MNTAVLVVSGLVLVWAAALLKRAHTAQNTCYLRGRDAYIKGVLVGYRCGKLGAECTYASTMEAGLLPEQLYEGLDPLDVTLRAGD